MIIGTISHTHTDTAYHIERHNPGCRWEKEEIQFGLPSREETILMVNTDKRGVDFLLGFLEW